MTKGLRITVYTAAALTLAALLVLLLMPSQARYLRTAQWQASYAASPSELTSDLLALRDDKAQLLLADWSPTAVEETKSVTFDMTCPAELLQVSTAEETAETQPAEPVSVTLGAVDTHLQAKTQVNCSPSSETGAANITVTLTLTVQAVPKSAVNVKLPIHLELAGAEGIWFGAKLSFTLCPTAGSGSTEVSSLFDREASMTEYDVTQPFYVQYTLPPDCTAAEMKLDNAGFPRGTRFSTDNGVSYSALCEDRPIPVTGSQSLLVDMSRATTGNGNRTLQLTANDQDGKVFTDTLALTAKSWSGHAAATYTEDGLPSMQIQPWNSGSLQVTAAVEQLARVEEPVLTEKQENTAQKQPQTTVKYVSADGVIRIEWTTEVEGEDAATEGNSPANAAETQTTQTLTLLPAKGIVPAGTYRVTICWKCGDVLIAERVIPFFVTR